MGLQPVPAPTIGDSSAALAGPAVNGTEYLYLSGGPLLYAVTGVAPDSGSDPRADSRGHRHGSSCADAAGPGAGSSDRHAGHSVQDSADHGAHSHRYPVANDGSDSYSHLHTHSSTDGSADAGGAADRHPDPDSASAPHCRAYPHPYGDRSRGPATAHGNNGAVTHGDTGLFGRQLRPLADNFRPGTAAGVCS